jgi:hypothetical protein
VVKCGQRFTTKFLKKKKKKKKKKKYLRYIENFFLMADRPVSHRNDMPLGRSGKA